MGQSARLQDFALEARKPGGSCAPRREQLDGSRAAQKFMSRAVDDAHAPFSDLALQRVVAELLGCADLLAQAVDDPRNQHRDRDHDQADEGGAEREVDGVGSPVLVVNQVGGEQYRKRGDTADPQRALRGARDQRCTHREHGDVRNHANR
jgi:hypothetical protein